MDCVCVTVVLSILLTSQAAHLPSYIKPCRRSDPKINECALKNGLAAIPYIVKGDKKLKIPNMMPLVLTEIVLQATSQLTIKLKDIKISGLENSVLKEARIDTVKRSTGGTLSVPSLTIKGEYEIDGKILVIPIKGSGPAEVLCENLNVNYTLDYELIVKDDGIEYINEDLRPIVSYTVGKVNFKLDNLFDGDKSLGDRTNEFLNEHSKEIHEDFAVSITKTVELLITKIVKSFVPLVPYNELFLP